MNSSNFHSPIRRDIVQCPAYHMPCSALHTRHHLIEQWPTCDTSCSALHTSQCAVPCMRHVVQCPACGTLSRPCMQQIMQFTAYEAPYSAMHAAHRAVSCMQQIVQTQRATNNAVDWIRGTVQCISWDGRSWLVYAAECHSSAFRAQGVFGVQDLPWSDFLTARSSASCCCTIYVLQG